MIFFEFKVNLISFVPIIWQMSKLFPTSTPRVSPTRRRSKNGQTLVEYGIILALVSVVAIGVLSAMGMQTKGVFTTVGNQLTDASIGGPPPAPPPRGG